MEKRTTNVNSENGILLVNENDANAESQKGFLLVERIDDGLYRPMLKKSYLGHSIYEHVILGITQKSMDVYCRRTEKLIYENANSAVVKGHYVFIQSKNGLWGVLKASGAQAIPFKYATQTEAINALQKIVDFKSNFEKTEDHKKHLFIYAETDSQNYNKPILAKPYYKHTINENCVFGHNLDGTVDVYLIDEKEPFMANVCQAYSDRDYLYIKSHSEVTQKGKVSKPGLWAVYSFKGKQLLPYKYFTKLDASEALKQKK